MFLDSHVVHFLFGVEVWDVLCNGVFLCFVLEYIVGRYVLNCLCEMLGEVLLDLSFGFLLTCMLVFPLGFLLDFMWNFRLGIEVWN